MPLLITLLILFMSASFGQQPGQPPGRQLPSPKPGTHFVFSKRPGPPTKVPDQILSIIEAVSKTPLSTSPLVITGDYTITSYIDNKPNTSKQGVFTFHASGYPAQLYTINYTPLVIPTIHKKTPFLYYNKSFSSDGTNDMWLDTRDPANPRGEIFNGTSVIQQAGPIELGLSSHVITAILANGLNLQEIIKDGEYDLTYNEAGSIITIEISCPGITSKATLILDKNKDYSLTSLTISAHDIPTEKAKGLIAKVEVSDFTQVNPSGLWIPTHIASTAYDADGVSIEFFQDVHYRAISADKTSPKYTLSFPPGTYLTDDRIGATMIVGSTPDATYQSIRPIVDDIHKKQDEKGDDKKQEGK